SIGGHLKNWRIWVFIDRDNDSRIFNTSQMLDRTGNTNSDVQLWCDDLAGLAYLIVVRRHAPIHRCAGRTDCASQRISQSANESLESFFVLQRAATAYNDGGFGQIRSAGDALFTRNELRPVRK